MCPMLLRLPDVEANLMCRQKTACILIRGATAGAERTLISALSDPSLRWLINIMSSMLHWWQQTMQLYENWRTVSAWWRYFLYGQGPDRQCKMRAKEVCTYPSIFSMMEWSLMKVCRTPRFFRCSSSFLCEKDTDNKSEHIWIAKKSAHLGI